MFGGDTFVNIIGLVANSTFSALLVILYFRQSNIQENQERLMRAGETPLVNIEEWDINIDEVNVLLSNTGGGRAIDLRVGVCFAPYSDSGHGFDMERIEDPGINFRSLNRKESRGGSNLTPGENDWFQRIVKFHQPKSNYSTNIFELIEHYKKEDVESLAFQLQISYSTLIDDDIRTYGTEIMIVDVSEISNFEDAYKKSGTLMLGSEYLAATLFLKPEVWQLNTHRDKKRY